MYSFLTKEITKGYKQKTILDNYKKILITINPIIPHLSKECLEIIDKNTKFNWPDYDEKQMEESSKLIVVQINGKKRGLINTQLNLSEEELFQLIKKDEKINKYLVDARIKKRIYIENKLINLII